MLTGDPVAHFVHQVVVFRMRAFQVANLAQGAQAGGAFRRRGMAGRVDEPPVEDLDRRRRQHAPHGRHRDHIAFRAEQGQKRIHPDKARGKAEHQI